MQKDVIYIDVEDDITAIIGKLKDAKQKVVALVPPKRIGVLQSAVNLRLLARTADNSNKHLVLITNNNALIALSAAAKIPIAKNLQSKPELAEIPALDVDNGDDVIDGSQLSVGELARTADKIPSSEVSDQVMASIENDDSTTLAPPPKPGTSPAKARIRSGIKVPSFSLFRKKLFLFCGLGVLFVGFLIWAIFFAAHATIIITARTTPTAVNTSVAIGPTLTTNAETAVLKSVVQTDKESSSVSFDATGTQDIGDKATGQVKLSVLSATTTPVPAGTQLTTSDGLVFVTDSAVTIPASVPCFPSFCAQSVNVAVTAAANGTKYNGATGNLSGAPGGASAQFTGPSAGGTEKIVKIVLQADVESAKTQLAAQNSDAIKKKLQAKFDSNTVIVDGSFQISAGSPISAPAIGKESPDGKAKLTSDVTYTLTGVTKGDLDQYLKAALQKQLSNGQQRVYDDGIGSVKLTGYTQTPTSISATINATGQIGPMINDNAIKEQAKGKRFGEIQGELRQIQGVSDADTHFSPFWVSSVPNDVNKIKIEFKLQNGS